MLGKIVRKFSFEGESVQIILFASECVFYLTKQKLPENINLPQKKKIFCTNKKKSDKSFILPV